MLSYEIHTVRNGQWKVDSVYDDRELAINDAMRAEETNRYAAIRVIEEDHDEESGETATRVVFRNQSDEKPAPKKPAAAKAAPRPAAAAPAAGRESARSGRAKRTAPGKKRGAWLLPVMVCFALLIVAGGGTAMFMLPR